MDQDEVYFLKMNNGEDLLCKLVGHDETCLYVTQPYRVEVMQTTATMTLTTGIMRWIPFESLMDYTISIDKKNILTYMLVDDIVAGKYINTIDQQVRKEREKETERVEQIRSMLMTQAVQRIANNSGTLH